MFHYNSKCINLKLGGFKITIPKKLCNNIDLIRKIIQIKNNEKFTDNITSNRIRKIIKRC